MSSEIVNVGQRLSVTAANAPDQVAVAVPDGCDRTGERKYRSVTFRELDDDSNRLALGLHRIGVRPGMRLVLMVRPGIDFISLVFALFKAGVVTVLIDPGMGRKNMIRCLEETRPEGFVAIPLAQAIRVLMRHRFRQARFNVTVGRRWFWGGATISQLRRQPADAFEPIGTQADDPAAIIFTTGSTGPPKGVLYRHGNFNKQVDEIRDRYAIQPGELDLPGFPLFALFNAAMGVTTVVPDMDFTRPADVDPRNIIEPIHDWKITQAFGSPALWNRVAGHCRSHNIQLPTLRRVLSAGAPVPPHVLQRMMDTIHPEGNMHTPYGATESLPVATISATEVLEETAERSRAGAGTCVGTRFPGIEWRVIRISDDPIERISLTEELPVGETGELIVRGEVVTREYVTRTEANADHKITDGSTFWHRMGDVGYLDAHDRFWFCGRKSHRVQTAGGTMFTICCEAIMNSDERVYRSALVGLGPVGSQRPVFIVESWPQHRPQTDSSRDQLVRELLDLAASNPLIESVKDVVLHESLPVDIRHNSKIFREQLREWVARQL